MKKLVMMLAVLSATQSFAGPLGFILQFLSNGGSPNQACAKTASYDDMSKTLARIGALPASYDSRLAISRFPAVRDQYVTDAGGTTHCGSCWAFASTAAIQIGLNLSYPKNSVAPLSEQQLVDCVTGSTCGGGSECSAFNWVTTNGQTSDGSLPYLGANGSCPAGQRATARVARWAYVGKQGSDGSPTTPTIAQLKAAILVYGSVVTTVNDDRQFSQYKTGVFGLDGESCADATTWKGTAKTNHVVVLVGWGTRGGQLYWILRNSFGADWGENGYMRIVPGCKGLAINQASYVVPAPVR